MFYKPIISFKYKKNLLEPKVANFTLVHWNDADESKVNKQIKNLPFSQGETHL